jgi:HlyD family secretion protein
VILGPGANQAEADDVERTLGVGAHSRKWRKRLVRFLIMLLLAAVGAVAVRGLLRVRRPIAGPRFETSTVTRADLRATVTATGTLQAVGTVEVGSEVSGRIQRVLVTYNAPVRKGDLLAEIDPVQLRAEVNQAESQVEAAVAGIAQADATLLESKQSLDRTEAQAREALASTKDLEGARATYARAQANVASAKASAAIAGATRKSAQWKLAKTRIVSPIDGIVLTRSIEPGQTVQAAFTTPVLFKIAGDLSRLELHVQVDEADIGRVHEGLAAEFHVDAYPEKTFASRVESLHNDSTTSNNVVTYEAVLSVDNSAHLLRPGMTATATIVSESRSQVVLVQNTALRFTPPAEQKAGGGMPTPPGGGAARIVVPEGAESKRHVFVLRDGQPSVVFVSTGATDGKSTEVLGVALTPGMQVVTDVLEEQP